MTLPGLTHDLVTLMLSFCLVESNLTEHDAILAMFWVLGLSP